MREKRKVRNVLAVLILVTGIVLAIYLGGWLLFTKPIMAACAAFDAGTLGGSVIGTTILKCLFAGPVTGTIWFITFTTFGVLRDRNVKFDR